MKGVGLKLNQPGKIMISSKKYDFIWLWHPSYPLKYKPGLLLDYVEFHSYLKSALSKHKINQPCSHPQGSLNCSYLEDFSLIADKRFEYFLQHISLESLTSYQNYKSSNPPKGQKTTEEVLLSRQLRIQNRFKFSFLGDLRKALSKGQRDISKLVDELKANLPNDDDFDDTELCLLDEPVVVSEGIFYSRFSLQRFNLIS